MFLTPAASTTFTTSAAGIAFTAPSLRWQAITGCAEILRHDDAIERVTMAEAASASPVETVRSALGCLEAQTWRIRHAQAGVELWWTIGRFRDRPGFAMQAGIRNLGSEPIRLRRIVLLDGADDALQVEGDPARWRLDSAQNGMSVGDLASELPSVDDRQRRVALAFNLPAPAQVGSDERRRDGRWRLFRDHLSLATDGGRDCLAIGPWGDPVADLDIACRVDRGRVRVVIASEMSDLVLAPGASRSSQGVTALWGEHAACVTDILRGIAATHGARTHRGPWSGWCSWYHVNFGVAPEDIIGIAQAADDDRLPLQVVQIDDGWQTCYGDWRPNQRFAAGWGPCLDAIAKRGAQPGIWVAPLRVKRGSGLIERHPDWFQRHADGRLYGPEDEATAREGWLDPTHPEVQVWIRDLLRGLRATGFTFFKLDFSHVQEGIRLHDTCKTRFQAARELHALYREAIGEDAYMLGCLGMSRAVAGYADANRTGPDACAFWRAENPCNIEGAIRATVGSALSHGILWSDDPDAVYSMPTGQLTEAENRTWLGRVALLGGPTMTSDPFNAADREVGRVEVRRSGSDLQVEATLDDERIAIDPVNPWSGSSIEIFHTIAGGGHRQYFLTPASEGRPAWIGMMAPGGIVAASGMTVESRRIPGGWAMSARLPGVADHAGFAVEAKLNPYCRVSGPGLAPSHVEVVVFGAASPFASSTGYTALADGQCLRGAAQFRGRAGHEDAFARMVPPAPERGTAWSSGTDPDGAQFGFVAHRPWGSFGVIQIHNPEDAPAVRSLQLDGLRNLGEQVHVFDFWQRRWFGLCDPGSLKFELPSHGPVLLRLTPSDGDLPVLVGSTLHYSQGAAEIADWRAWKDGLEIELRPAGAASGELWIHDDSELVLTGCQGLGATIARMDGLWRVAINGRRRSLPQHLAIRRSGA
jgi:hypothetical protein